MRLHTDERGTVFWAVLAVLLVTCLLLSTVVFYGARHQSQNRRLLYETQARYLALAALEQSRARLQEKSADRDAVGPVTLGDSLPEHRGWSASLAPWGCYWRALCRGKSHQIVATVDALLGCAPTGDLNFALRLFGPPYPLVVAGETQIRGDVAVGPAGVTAGEYRGRRRRDTVLVRGRIVADSPPRAPAMDWSIWQAFEGRTAELRSRLPVCSDRTLIVDDQFVLTPADSVIVVDAPVTITRTRPFLELHPVLVVAAGPVTVGGNAALDARWAIVSDRSIDVKDSAHVAGVVLRAPRIVIADAARFSGQALADTLLAITARAATRFPCLLWVTGNGDPAAHPLLHLGSLERCQGIAGIAPVNGPWDWYYRAGNTGELRLDSQAHWTGYLQVSGRADIRGTVTGSVQAELLAFEDPPTTYLNWLLNAHIDRTLWAGEAALPALFAREGPWCVAEFLASTAPESSRPSMPKMGATGP